MPRTRNNFEFLRIFAALAVLFSHHFILSGLNEPALPGVISLGGLAVMVFFSVSGFLVTQSWITDRNAFRFLGRRFLRIWPALTVVVSLTVLVLGPLVTSLPLSDYFAHPATWDYFRILLMQIHFPLPGVFTHNPYSNSVNGSLWTIPFEVRCYLVMGAIGLVGLLRSPRWLIAWCLVFFVWYVGKGLPDHVGRYVPGREFSAHFVAGVFLCCCKHWWLPHAKLVMLVTAALGVLLYVFGFHYLALLVMVPVLSIGFGMQSTPVVSQFGRFGDPSFGIYLYAFPVQQTLIYACPDLNFYVNMLAAAVITIALAYASWRWIEKPALRFKPRKPTASTAS